MTVYCNTLIFEFTSLLYSINIIILTLTSILNRFLIFSCHHRFVLFMLILRTTFSTVFIISIMIFFTSPCVFLIITMLLTYASNIFLPLSIIDSVRGTFCTTFSWARLNNICDIASSYRCPFIIVKKNDIINIIHLTLLQVFNLHIHIGVIIF